MSFKDIKGQDRPIRTLKESIANSHLAGAYLFTGPEGIGKALTAKMLAKALNCDEAKDDSCDKCASCVKIEKNEHPDLHIIAADQAKGESSESDAIKIGHVRQLQRDINLKPYEGRKKVFIIDNAHHLTGEAANALLKVLEEVPQASIIILISSKTALMFKTIISRCRLLKFYPSKRQELEDILRKDYSLHLHLAHFLAYFCEGRLGQAVKLKDTDILRQKNSVIDELVFSSRAADNITAKNKADLRASLNILASWFRDIYLMGVGMPQNELIHLDRKAELIKVAASMSFLELDRILKCISDSILSLEQNMNSKLILSNLRMELWKM